MSLKTKTQNVRVGGVEETDENKFYAAPSTSACDPENASMSSPNKSRSSSLDVLQVSDTFCFPTYLRLCFILISCSSVKAEQILHGFSLVTPFTSFSASWTVAMCIKREAKMSTFR